jgi:beta-glucosidase
MLKVRSFQIVIVGKDHGTGVEITGNPDKVVSYQGEQQVVELSGQSEPRTLSSYDPQVKELLSRMTLDEKIGQMTQADQERLKEPADIAKYYIGSVLSGGNSDPAAGNSLTAWANLYDRCQQQALTTRLGIPILYGIDAVHGHNNVIGAVIFPHNIGLGCTRDPELVEKIGRITAEEVRASGIQWTFAPCVTVPRDERWGRTYEGFSEDPNLVSILGAAAVRGLQGPSLSDDLLSLLACAKHYAGDGGTMAVARGRAGVHLDQGNTKVDEQALRRLFLPPYIAAIKAGVGTIMPSYSSWNGVKCSASHRLLTEILKQELGFEGFLISDWQAINQVDPDYKTAVKISINAGMDMGMVPDNYREFSKYLKELVEEGAVPMSRINDAVTRILRVKFAMGLMDKNRSFLADRRLFESFGSEKHRLVARQAVRESMVLLKNKANILPLSKTSHIHVGGKNADNLGCQCGGWTITWEGRNGNFVPGGTSILSGIRNTMARTAVMTFSVDGSGAEGADVGVVVIGEKPYAEGMGDRADLALDKADIEAVDNMKKAGIPLVVILISGRPVIIGDVLDKADALIAAWLPGTEGQGVADVLFGDYKPTGKLSYTWPKSMDQIPLGVANPDPDKALFPYRFGLTY